MTTPLIEAIARALEHNPQRHGWVSYESDAQAALTAISEAGYAVVPIEPTEAMWDRAMEEGYDCDPSTYYRAMISAAQGTGNGKGAGDRILPQENAITGEPL